MNYSIEAFGAVPDGKTDCSPAVQRAVDTAFEAGGGTVFVPAGRWLSGSVLLKSNVELRLSAGAVLLSSLEPDHILPFPAHPGKEAIDGFNGGFFLGALDGENISISGEGTIDGQGERVFFDADTDRGAHECPLQCASFRPRMMLFENIRNLHITGVTLKNAAFWTLHMAGCRHVRIHDILILNQDRGANNDGIDPDCCQDVVISGCQIETGDDAVVLKSTAPMARRYGPCENIVITGCVLHSRDSALKIGTETHGTIRRVVFSDSIVRDCSRGVGIWVRDGGTVEDIQVHHLTGSVRRYADAYDLPGAPGWWGKGEPVFLSATRRRGKEDSFPGTIRNLYFSDLRLDCESSLFLGGEKDCRIENVFMRDVHLRFIRQGTQPGGLFDEQPSARHVYPHSIPALYARSVRRLTFSGTVQFTGEGEAWDGTREETEDCEDVRIRWDDDRFSGMTADSMG